MVCVIASIMQKNCTTRAVRPNVCLHIYCICMWRCASVYVVYTASCRTMLAPGCTPKNEVIFIQFPRTRTKREQNGKINIFPFWRKKL